MCIWYFLFVIIFFVVCKIPLQLVAKYVKLFVLISHFCNPILHENEGKNAVIKNIYSDLYHFNHKGFMPVFCFVQPRSDFFFKRRSYKLFLRTPMLLLLENAYKNRQNKVTQIVFSYYKENRIALIFFRNINRKQTSNFFKIVCHTQKQLSLYCRS